MTYSSASAIDTLASRSCTSRGRVEDGALLGVPGGRGPVSFRMLHVFEIADGKITGPLRGDDRHTALRRLFTHLGRGPALTQHDIVGAAVEAEDLFGYSSLTPTAPSIIEQLAQLTPSTLAVMHGSSFTGDGASTLHDLAEEYRRRIASVTRNDLAAAATT